MGSKAYIAEHGGNAYSRVHNAMRKQVPNPGICADCNFVYPCDLANVSDNYLYDIKDWVWLCRSCHMKRDGRANRIKQFRSKKLTEMGLETVFEKRGLNSKLFKLLAKADIPDAAIARTLSEEYFERMGVEQSVRPATIKRYRGLL